MLTYLLIYVITQGDFTLQNEEIEDIVSPVIPSVQPACTVKAQQSLGLLKETQSEGEKCSQRIKYKTFLVAVLFMKNYVGCFTYISFLSFPVEKSELLSVGLFAFEDVEPFLDKIATDSTKTTIKKNDFVALINIHNNASCTVPRAIIGLLWLLTVLNR